MKNITSFFKTYSLIYQITVFVFYNQSLSASVDQISPVSCLQDQCGKKQTLSHPFEKNPTLVKETYNIIDSKLGVYIDHVFLRKLNFDTYLNFNVKNALKQPFE